jgi:hypothetical protein
LIFLAHDRLHDAAETTLNEDLRDVEGDRKDKLKEYNWTLQQVKSGR